MCIWRIKKTSQRQRNKQSCMLFNVFALVKNKINLHKNHNFNDSPFHVRLQLACRHASFFSLEDAALALANSNIKAFVVWRACCYGSPSYFCRLSKQNYDFLLLYLPLSLHHHAAAAWTISTRAAPPTSPSSLSSDSTTSAVTGSAAAGSILVSNAAVAAAAPPLSLAADATM